jgi:FkbM family methyltransferase
MTDNILFIGSNDMNELENQINNNTFNYTNGLFIEALPNIYQQLVENLELINKKYNKKFSPINALLTNEENKKYIFNVFSNNGGSSSIFEPNKELWDATRSWKKNKVVNKIELLSTTINNILKKYNWKEKIYDLVIDVQGAELLVLKGFEKIDFSNIQTIKIEISNKPFYKDGVLFPELKTFLDENGFKFSNYIPGRRGIVHSDHCDAIFVKKN